MTKPSTCDSNLFVGTAGEYIVCADLLLSGFTAFRSDQTAPYDVAVEVSGHLVRVQVKSSRAPRAYPQHGSGHVIGYMWNCRRGKGATRKLDSTEFDVLALVALDIRRVAYVPSGGIKNGIRIHTSGNKRPSAFTFERCTFASAIRSIGGSR